MNPPLTPGDLMAELARLGRARCLLCGRPPSRLGVWVPTRTYSDRLGAPPGKTRTIAYCLCKKCVRRPGTPAAVEDKILAEAAAALARTEAN